MNATSKIVYLFDNREFKSVEAMREHVEAEIGSIIERNLRFRLTPTDALSVVSAIVGNRERVASLLKATIDDEIDLFSAKATGEDNK